MQRNEKTPQGGGMTDHHSGLGTELEFSREK